MNSCSRNLILLIWLLILFIFICGHCNGSRAINSQNQAETAEFQPFLEFLTKKATISSVRSLQKSQCRWVTKLEISLKMYGEKPMKMILIYLSVHKKGTFARDLIVLDLSILSKGQQRPDKPGESESISRDQSRELASVFKPATFLSREIRNRHCPLH
ncbi:Uncharacterized protein Adt_04866 [Abeliophyllum distichum]|uniref:Uncharacterized protein n=1 Tax=Abeliophyllum distichum TaxID=126358 RepID=A0ABD1V4G7_9LAMI